MCEICCDECPHDEMYSLSCGHWFCTDCWGGYLESKINSQAILITCPQQNCPIHVPLDMPSVLCSKEAVSKSHSSILKAFVEDRVGSRLQATYCKNPRGCEGVVILADDSACSEAMCSLCGYAFCASCDFPSHLPATCEMIASWDQMGGYIETGRVEDLENRKLKHQTTKPCPKCGIRIEKNQGCPHMSCRCKHQVRCGDGCECHGHGYGHEIMCHSRNCSSYIHVDFTLLSANELDVECPSLAFLSCITTYSLSIFSLSVCAI